MSEFTAARVLPVARTCGTCTACCKVVGFLIGDNPKNPDHVKARGTWCRHAEKGKGCGIQATKPPACAEWSCYWLLGWAPLADQDRPDRCGLVIDSGAETNFLPQPATMRNWPVIFAHEQHRGAAASPAGLDLIHRLGDQGFAVMIADHNGPREIVWPGGTSNLVAATGGADGPPTP